MKRGDARTFFLTKFTLQIANLAEVLRSCKFLFVFNKHAVDFDLSTHNPIGYSSYFTHVFRWKNRTLTDGGGIYTSLNIAYLTLGTTGACITFYKRQGACFEWLSVFVLKIGVDTAISRVVKVVN